LVIAVLSYAIALPSLVIALPILVIAVPSYAIAHFIPSIAPSQNAIAISPSSKNIAILLNAIAPAHPPLLELMRYNASYARGDRARRMLFASDSAP